MTFKSNVTKSLICSAVALATVGSAVKTPAFAGPPLSATTCPALEGYPDCHPDAPAQVQSIQRPKQLWLYAGQQKAKLERGSAHNGGFRTRWAASNEIQDRYCLQGTDFGYPGSCQFSTYDQCMASASGRAASCGINPADGYTHQQREWILHYGGARHF